MQISKPLVYVLIGARGGSKGIPRKNIAPVAGYPLIAFSIAAARLSKLVDRVIVSTDDREIAETAKRFGAEVPFMRPKELAGDRSLDVEFIKHAVEWLRDTEQTVPDFLVHLRPPVPAREPRVIDQAIKEIMADDTATSLRSAHEFLPPAFKLFRLDGPYCAFFGGELFRPSEEFFNYPRQRLPKTYHVNGYVDVIRPSCLLESGLLYGGKMRAFITGPAPDIDEPRDLAAAETELKKPEYAKLFGYLKGVQKV